MTPEGKIKEKIKQVCKKHGAYYHMPVQNGMGRPTLDFIICLEGKFIAVEAKSPGKKPTPRQELTIKEIQRAGGFALVVDDDISLNAFDIILTTIKNEIFPV